jgi:hypothetical protein
MFDEDAALAGNAMMVAIDVRNLMCVEWGWAAR